ncbi:MAG TPA: cyclopropane-fatty-acyl-phospholipid synthase family protein [Candidatus Tumulicola sp.]
MNGLEPRDRYAELALDLLRLLFGDAFARDFGVKLWNGTIVTACGPLARFTLHIKHPAALREMLRRPVDLGGGRAFVAGLIDVEGDLELAIDALLQVTAVDTLRAFRIMSLARRLPRSPIALLREARLHGRAHTLERDRAAIGFHYDLPIEFYQTFLDDSLTYSCAYFDEGIETLDAAQRAKIDHIFRKIRLERNERILDIGCGWGGLVVRASSVFGARATGITLSEPQFQEARRRVAAEGARADVRLCDYRELKDETFDKAVSVGMFEHVGRRNLKTYFKAAFAALRPGGLFLNHGIANQNVSTRDNAERSFIGRFIFPDGDLLRISEALRIAESVGFEIRDVENLRQHYVRTLAMWVASLERNRERAISVAGEQTYRAWRLYMAGSAQGFRSGRLGLYQVLLGRPDNTGSLDIPATRRDIYRAPIESFERRTV